LTGIPRQVVDRGRQYISQQFASLAKELGLRLSVGRAGQCWDNALAESFFATIKRELLGTAAWPSRASARTAIFDFIEVRGLVQLAPTAQQPRIPQPRRL
jgi:transposase InsO family protein